MIKLSFILPCHNVSKYIGVCLDSIYANNLQISDYEVICVDDVSTDNTIDVIENLQQSHANLRLICHSVNKASGGARNTGLRAAKGDYIWYVDPDDMICSEKVAQFVEKCETNNLDVLCFNYQDIDEQQNIIDKPRVFDSVDPQNGLDFVKQVFGDSIVYHIGYIWRFIYRREFLLQTNMFFPENVVWQDTVYMPRPLFLAQRVQSVSETGYKYWHHDSSVCGSFDRQYTGRKIYIWSFSAGVNVLHFSKELEQIDMHYAKLFHDFARNYYINKFPQFLWKTSHVERSAFYKIMGEHKDVYTSVQNEQSLLTRLHLLPIAGPMVADLFALLFSMKTYLSGMKEVLKIIKNSLKYPRFAWRHRTFWTNPRKYVDSIYQWCFHKSINWAQPEDLNQIIQWLKINSDTSKWSLYADKYRVREYVAKCGYADILVPLYGHWDSVSRIDMDALPNQFIMKVNNGSGDTRVCLSKEKIDKEEWKRYFFTMLHRKFGFDTYEPHYQKMKPCIIAEALLDCKKQSYPSTSLIDYKVWCFNGKAQYIWVVTDRKGDACRHTLYDTNWEQHNEMLLSTEHYVMIADSIPQPINLKRMLAAAETLAADNPLIRVDFYEVDGNLYFGEMTMSGFGGFCNCYTQDALVNMGDLIKYDYC